MNKKIFFIVGAVLTLFAIATIKRMRAITDFMYAGTAETTKIMVSTKVSGDILSFPIEEGQTLNKGDLIAKIDDEKYEIASKQIDSDFKRVSALASKGHSSIEELERIERLKRDNDLQKQWCEVKSPISGVVVTKFKEQGEFANMGTYLISLADPKDVWVYFYVPHDVVHKLKIGAKVDVVLSEMSQKKLEGRIIKINEEAEFTPKNVQTREERTRLVYGVKVKIENKDLLIKSGMTLESNLE